MATNGLSLHLQDDDIDVSMYALGELMEDFSHAYLPLVDSLYGISSLKLRTALQQIFALLFAKNGCGPGATFGARGRLGLSSSKPEELPGVNKPPKRPCGPSSQSRKSSARSEFMLSQLVTLVLHHEDQFKAQNTEMEFVIRRGSVIPTLMKSSQGWHVETNKGTSLR